MKTTIHYQSLSATHGGVVHRKEKETMVLLMQITASAFKLNFAWKKRGKCTEQLNRRNRMPTLINVKQSAYFNQCLEFTVHIFCPSWNLRSKNHNTISLRSWDLYIKNTIYLRINHSMSLKTCYSFKAAAIFFWMSSTPRRGDNLGRISWNRDWFLSEISSSKSDVHKSIVNADFLSHLCLQAELLVHLTLTTCFQ